MRNLGGKVSRQIQIILRIEERIQCCDMAIYVNPQNNNAQKRMGLIDKLSLQFSIDNLNHFQEAIECYDKDIQLNPKNKDETLD